MLSGIWVPPKIRVYFSLELCPKLWTHASLWCGQQNSSTMEHVNYAYDGRARCVTGCTKFITRRLTLTFCLHYFDLCRISCTNCSSTVMQQLAKSRLIHCVCCSRASCSSRKHGFAACCVCRSAGWGASKSWVGPAGGCVVPAWPIRPIVTSES